MASINHLPTALVLGPQRAGTTWIYEYLKSRGDVTLPKSVKETFFFDRHYARGVNWYSKRFAPAPGGAMTAEVASTYFHCAEAVERVAETLNDPTLVVTLRDPADRVFSLHRHLVRFGITKASLREAFSADAGGLQSSSRYTSCLRRWIGRFGQDRVGVLFLEDLRDDPAGHAGRISAALGLPPRSAPRSLMKTINAGLSANHLGTAFLASRAAAAARRLGGHGLINAAKRIGVDAALFRQGNEPRARLSLEDRAWLIEQLNDEIYALEELLSGTRDLADWATSEKPDASAA